MTTTFPVTAVMFKAMTGRVPIQDDLERCNCKKAGQIGHYSCGMCKHDMPVFRCQPCFTLSHDLKGRQTHG